MIPAELKPNAILNVYNSIKPFINTTPLLKANDFLDELFNTNLYFKCEYLQKSGSFKSRGAINNVLSLNKDQLKNGITAVSAGNHAIATSFVSNIFKLKNKIFLYNTANNYRINICKKLNANIIFTDAKNAFDNVKKAEKEGYKFIHPFDGKYTLQGTSTLGYEIYNQLENVDNILMSIGGGGLISGVGSYIKQMNPKVKIIGIEPIGAKGMYESFKNNLPEKKVKINSIADSLCAPLHMPYSFNIAKQVIDEIVTINDNEIKDGMKFAAKNLKMFLEPAAVCGIVALKKYFNNKFMNQNTILLLCGSNIDYESWKNIVN